MTSLPVAATTLAIFCKVVDNFGDIGICWRMARQFQSQHKLAVTLWVDDLASFRRICPAVDAGAALQHVEQVTVRHWADQDGHFGVHEIADIVIEFFGCALPPAYVDAMAQCAPRPVWINFEGLSAEEWVEGCHTLPSPHPRLPLTKHFFFPGFTTRTGGLLREAGLDAQRRRFQADPAARTAFLASCGVSAAEAQALCVSLFCYPSAPLASLFGAWEQGATPLTCLVPEGVASAATAAFLGAPARPGAVATRGALTLRVIPFQSQQDYDRLLWSCDLNFVRGEDSWVRAQWAARPFVWHIYEQDDNLHHKKLRAFLDCHAGVPAFDALALHWNGAVAGSAGALPWPPAHAALEAARDHAEAWLVGLLAQPDLASQILAFAARVSSVNRQNSGIMPG